MLGKVKSTIAKRYRALKFAKAPKVFCIGRNKTGTTSMHKLLKELGFHVGSQKVGEMFIEDWSKGNFDPIIQFARTGGNAFQDMPFGLPGTYKVLDEHFPDSKFILTIRDSPEVWYDSLVRFHSEKFGHGNIPTKADLLKADYRRPGFVWETMRMIYQTPEDDIYHKDTLIAGYIQHNEQVIDYFKDRPSKLLVVNLKEADVARSITEFLDVEKSLAEIPWENKSGQSANGSKA